MRVGNRVRGRETHGKWENSFIKNYITCNVNLFGDGIKTTVTFVGLIYACCMDGDGANMHNQTSSENYSQALCDKEFLVEIYCELQEKGDNLLSMWRSRRHHPSRRREQKHWLKV